MKSHRVCLLALSLALSAVACKGATDAKRCQKMIEIREQCRPAGKLSAKARERSRKQCLKNPAFARACWKITKCSSHVACVKRVWKRPEQRALIRAAIRSARQIQRKSRLERMRKRREARRKRAEELRKKRLEAEKKMPPMRPVLGCYRSSFRVGRASLEDPTNKQRKKPCHTSLSSDGLTAILTFRGLPGSKLQVDGVKKVSADKALRFQVDVRERFFAALAKVPLPPKKRGKTQYFPTFTINIPFAMSHPKRPSFQGVYKLHGQEMLLAWLHHTLAKKQPALLTGERRRARASGKVALMVTNKRVYYLTNRGGTFRDVRKIMKSIKYPTRSKRCGPYVGRRTGRRKYYRIEYTDLLEGIFARTSGRRMGRKRFWARGRCPRSIRYGRAPSYSYSSSRYYRWLGRQVY